LTPDTALAAVLATAGVGTVDSTIFTGIERAENAELFPDASVFVWAGSAQAPQPYIGTANQSLYRARVSVVTRGTSGDFQTSLVKARTVIAAGHLASVSGYISCVALDSEPNWLGYDNMSRPRWLVTFLLEIKQA